MKLSSSPAATSEISPQPAYDSPASPAGERHPRAEALVLGAGAAGLAAAAALRSAGVEAIVLEQADQVGASWRTRYDGLRLNTPGWMSTQPGYRASVRRYGEYPSRDAWIQYLEDYVAHHRIDVRFCTRVRNVAPAEGGWRVDTDGGELDARFVVIATGFDREPNLPDWPGRDGFTGELIHSSSYRNPDPYRDRDVLVIGPNITGSEVAHFLSRGGVGRVRVSCRTPPNVMRRKYLGIPVQLNGVALQHLPPRVADEIIWRSQRLFFGNLERYGLPRSPLGVATTLRRRQQAPVFDDGFVAGVKAGRIEIVAAVEGFDGPDVLLADGTRIHPHAVIAATGYRRGLQDLVGHLGVLDEDGVPLVSGGKEHPSAPGLFFNGYRSELSGQLRLMRPDARAIARAARRQRA
jgi:putative flavoprotein involved in K+ transport